MRKEIKSLMKDLSTAKTEEDIKLIRSKLSVYLSLDNIETKKKELELKRKEVSNNIDMRQKELELKTLQYNADLKSKNEALELQKEELDFKKGQTVANIQNGMLSTIITAAISVTKIGAFGLLSMFMHKKENIDYEKESSFSKELRQGILK